MVVVGLMVVAYVDRCRSAMLRLELTEAVNKVWYCESEFIELVRIWKAHDANAVTFRDDSIEIKTGDNSYRGFSLSDNERRLIHEYKDVPYPLHFK